MAVSSIVFITSKETPPELALLSHSITTVDSASRALLELDGADLVIVDGVVDLTAARATCQALSRGNLPIMLVVARPGLAVLSPEWGFNDFVVAGSEPAEFDARIRMLTRVSADPDVFIAGPLRVDGAAYTATLDGVPLDLTYTEFELLRYLMQHPGRVLSRETLVSQVWGYDYYGGTRTVDVHVRRLRAKLGQFDHYIGTVRNVGYRFASAKEAHRAG